MYGQKLKSALFAEYFLQSTKPLKKKQKVYQEKVTHKKLKQCTSKSQKVPF